MPEDTTDFYCVGGTMERSAKSYVTRDTDEILYRQLKAGNFCYVLNPRQVGKSSLMIKVAESLKADEVSVAIVDLQSISKSLSAEKWYYAILRQIGRGLGIEKELRSYWVKGGQPSGEIEQDFALSSPLEKWINALREVVLPKCTGQIVIFVDEIDYVRSYTDFSADEFFAAIRFLYNEQGSDKELKRLSFCFIGVATPSDLIRDTRVTPFNIGQRIELKDFTALEAQSLARGLGRDESTNKELLERIFYWTGGHPFITQNFCQTVATDPTVKTTADIDRVCQELYLAPDVRGKDNNLLFVRDRLLLKESAEREPRPESELMGLLSLYSQIHKGKRVPDNESNPLVSILRLSGIVRSKNGFLETRNRIYQTVFDQKWIEDNMPDSELRKQRTIYRRRLAGISIGAMAMAFLAIFSGVQWVKAENALKELGLTKESLETREETIKKQDENISKKVEENSLLINDLKEKTDDLDKTTKTANEAVELLQIKKREASDAIELAEVKTREANEAVTIAKEKTEQADIANKSAEIAVGVAEEQKFKSKHLFYANNMKMAESFYKNSDIDSFAKILNETDPNLRGFEWKYLNQKLDGRVHFDVSTQSKGNRLAFVPNSNYLVTAERISGNLYYLNLATGKGEFREINNKIKGIINDFSISSDGKLIALIVDGYEEDNLVLLDTDTWESKLMDDFSVLSEKEKEKANYKFVSFSNKDKDSFFTIKELEKGLIYTKWNIGGKSISKEITPPKITKEEFFELKGVEVKCISPNGRYISLNYDRANIDNGKVSGFSHIQSVIDVEENEEIMTHEISDKMYGLNECTFSSDESLFAQFNARNNNIGNDKTERNVYFLFISQLNTQAKLFEDIFAISDITGVDPSSGLAFSPDGSQIAVAANGRVKAWDLKSLKNPPFNMGSSNNFPPREIGGIIPEITGFAFSSDGKSIAMAGNKLGQDFDEEATEGLENGRIEVWKISDELYFDEKNFLQISRDFKSLLIKDYPSADSYKWNLWDTQSLSLLKEEDYSKFASFTFSANGEYFFSTDGNFDLSSSQNEPVIENLRIWNTKTAGQEIKLKTSNYCLVENEPVFSSNSKMLASFCEDATIRIWNTETGEEVFNSSTLSFQNDNNSAGDSLKFIENDTKLILINSSQDKKFKMWDILNQKEYSETELNKLNNNERVMNFSVDGKWLVTLSGNQELKLRESSKGSQVKILPQLPNESIGMGSISFSPDSTFLVLADYTLPMHLYYLKDTAVREINLESEELSFPSLNLVFSPDEKWLYDVNNRIIWNTKTWQKVKLSLSNQLSSKFHYFSQDSSRLIVGFENGITFVDPLIGQELYNFTSY